MAEKQICADCGHDNAPGQAFCGACGQVLSPICPSCGEKNPSTFRFCGACGSEMAPTAPIAAALEGERRWVTVLFGDLAGFTHMSAAADPEDLRLMVDRCTTRMGEIVERYGGWVDKVIGDAPAGGVRGARFPSRRRRACGSRRTRDAGLRDEERAGPRGALSKGRH